MPPTELHRRVAETGEQPKMRLITLRFEDEVLERHYQRDYTPAMMGITRFGILLTVSLYLIFAVTDFWTHPEQLDLFWFLRGSTATLLLGIFAWSWHGFFVSHQQHIMLVVVLFVAANIALLFSLMSGQAEYQHFIGLFLLIVGAYTVLGLQFHYTMMVGVAATLFYVVVDVFVKDFSPITSFINMLFLFSTMVITAAGARNADKQRRLAYYGRLLVEHEREESRQSALHDPLTGLANRRLLTEKLAHAVARDIRFNTQAAVMFMDLDNFKSINDTYGHAFGDKLLKEVGLRLVACVRTTDTVARLGGDELVVLVEDLRNPDDLQLSLARIRACLAEPAHINGVNIDIAMSIGCAMHPQDGDEPRALLDVADREMYRAKRQRVAANPRQ